MRGRTAKQDVLFAFVSLEPIVVAYTKEQYLSALDSEGEGNAEGKKNDDTVEPEKADASRRTTLIARISSKDRLFQHPPSYGVSEV